ncbi:MAG: hypothetical protein OSJ44_15970, partial [Lachnospiraceae bacterium]|nr:hypothetical protein [Lachnospiraceae bacterium]
MDDNLQENEKKYKAPLSMHLISLQTLVLRNVNNLSFSGCPIARTKNLNAVRIEQVIPLLRR